MATSFYRKTGVVIRLLLAIRHSDEHDFAMASDPLDPRQYPLRVARFLVAQPGEEAASLRASELAARLGPLIETPEGTVRNWLTGHRPMPGVAVVHLRWLVKFRQLGVEMRDVAGGDGRRRKVRSGPKAASDAA